MTVSTSYLGKSKNDPNALLIANGCPSWYTGKHCKELAPYWSDVEHYKKTGETAEFISHYRTKLNTMGFERVCALIPDGAVLLCYERTGEFCHRHILAQWLREHGVTIAKEE